MKRIVKLSIDNYKAYIESISFEMPNGENVLIYGENGSGKSSLYKALRYFLSSSVSKGNYELNKYSDRSNGTISVVYMDDDPANVSVQANTDVTYNISTDSNITNNRQPEIALSYRVSGFLDYTQLLRVYLIDSSRPDLFSLVLDLIGDHIPIGQGINVPIKEDLNEALKELRQAYHRFDHNYIKAKERINIWTTMFSAVIDDLNKYVSRMMSSYFPDMHLQIKLLVPPIGFVDNTRIQDANIDGHIYLDVIHYSQKINDYNNTLNEARLSAIAICLYLASLKIKATMVESKILYLDDVFLGLDLGNRKPILDIVLHEFSDYQVFISTYDRSWYSQAKEILENTGRWKFIELYEGTTVDSNHHLISKPIIISSNTSFDKACSFMNDNEHPDYPAAANYLRKAYEELLQKKFYEPAVRNEMRELIPAYKLTRLVDACIKFIKQLHNYYHSQTYMAKYLSDLKGILRPLLHPLSHYVPNSPVYKTELRTAIRLYEQITKELEYSNYNTHCNILLEKGNTGILEINGISKWKYEYSIELLDHLYIYDATSGKSLSNCKCRVTYIKESQPGFATNTKHVSANSNLASRLTYDSLENCLKTIIAHNAETENKTDAINKPYMDYYSFHNETNSLVALNNLVASF